MRDRDDDEDCWATHKIVHKLMHKNYVHEKKMNLYAMRKEFFISSVAMFEHV